MLLLPPRRELLAALPGRGLWLLLLLLLLLFSCSSKPSSSTSNAALLLLLLLPSSPLPPLLKRFRALAEEERGALPLPLPLPLCQAPACAASTANTLSRRSRPTLKSTPLSQVIIRAAGRAGGWAATMSAAPALARMPLGT